MLATGNFSSFKNEYDLSQITLQRGKDDSLRGIVDSFQTEYNNEQAFNPQSNWLPCSKKNQHVGLPKIKAHSLATVLTKKVSCGVCAV